MTKDISNFDFSRVSAGYRLCFNGGCPKCSECIRYVAGQHLPGSVTYGPAIYPNALGAGECPFFTQAQEIRAAWGFAPLYQRVQRHHRAPIRKAITAYLGSVGTYYRYNSGERKLSTEQQRHIMDIMGAYGYTDDLAFEHYEASYNF
ncbi:MAG: hypothetical protein IJ544_00445 [Prevotella sp.]|nr:hypothetical protein [Prevotella sp.]